MACLNLNLYVGLKEGGDLKVPVKKRQAKG
jgi:hypothetical protein